MAQIRETIENNKGKTISAGIVAILFPLLTYMETTYVRASDLKSLESRMDRQEISTSNKVQENRKKYLEDQLFILKFKEQDPNEDKDLNRALQDRYKTELNAIMR